MDASVEFLLQSLKELVVYHVQLISGAEEDLNSLGKDLDQLKSILKDSSKKVTKHETFKTWEKQIRETVYDVEDTIDNCITKMAAGKSKRRSFLSRAVSKSSSVDLAKAVRELREKRVKPLLGDVKSFLDSLSVPDGPDKRTQETRSIRQTVRQNNIVGLEEEASTIINCLNEETDNLEIITIVGMPGLGKTTLAWKVFQDPRITFEYPILIWVNVSEELNLENVLKTILRKFTGSLPPDESDINVLMQTVRRCLATEKFLIVMDDVWTANAWNQIKGCLPEDNEQGRVLITSRHKTVGTHANPMKEPHYQKPLSRQASWELLQYEVYRKLYIVPEELIPVGKSIAINCDGLPLSIVVIGGILKDKMSTAGKFALAIKKEWVEISKSVQSYLLGKDGENVLEKIISLSYERLPYEVRNCFLYLGMFPEDAEIPVKKLARLWIAEGFVPATGELSLERIAEDNIKDLINRNLLMVREEKPGGEAKLVQVHDTIREFCKKEAAFKEQNLFQEINKPERGGPFVPSPDTIAKSRRLCIHSYVLEFFNKQPQPQVSVARSFLCFHKSPIILSLTDISPVTDNFVLLRVFEAENMKFPKLPKMLLQLMHLRYLTLALIGEEQNFLPEIVSNLWNLQTLILIISSNILEVKADIWNMRQLRHFKTNASIILKKGGEGQGNENLQTLGRLSPGSCRDDVFSKAKSLLTLGIQGDLSTNVESLCLEKLSVLHKLKLVHAVDQGVASEKPMPYLPERSRFPPKLKFLVLKGTYLEWGEISMLEKLVFLEKLKLKENACRGDSWDVGAGFKCLELLHIERSDLMDWTISGDSFTNLRFLVIKNCEKLMNVPSSIGKHLEMLYMERVTQEAVSSAHKIETGRQKEGGFKLDIAPADKQQS